MAFWDENCVPKKLISPLHGTGVVQALCKPQIPHNNFLASPSYQSGNPIWL